MNTTPLFQWQASEFAPRVIGHRFYMITGALLILIIVFALFTNSPIMAITFILIGIMGFITLEQEPQILSCAIHTQGIAIDRQWYDFENIESFWIVYEEDEQYISLKTNGSFLSFVRVPLDKESPVDIRRVLLEHIREEKHEPRLIDTIEKMLHIG